MSLCVILMKLENRFEYVLINIYVGWYIVLIQLLRTTSPKPF